MTQGKKQPCCSCGKYTSVPLSLVEDEKNGVKSLRWYGKGETPTMTMCRACEKEIGAL